MADIENVVNGLLDIGAFIAGRLVYGQARSYFKTIDDAIVLLKEQEAVVRCKYCKYFDVYNVECMKEHHPNPPYDRWFCADGERR